MDQHILQIDDVGHLYLAANNSQLYLDIQHSLIARLMNRIA